MVYWFVSWVFFDKVMRDMFVAHQFLPRLAVQICGVCLFPREQADKNKGRESCSGLDEAGNDLGDITLGFFLRQVNTSEASDDFVSVSVYNPWPSVDCRAG